MESRSTWMRAGLLGLVATAWSALLLGEIGRFSAAVCLIAGVATAAVLLWCERGTRGAQRPSVWTVCTAAVAFAAVAVAWHPGELILGGWDPGVYLHTAAHLARTGELLIREPDLARLTGQELAILTRTTSGIVGPFTGMWQLPDGSLSPQFHHLYPSLLAVAYGVGGIRAALLVNPLLSGACVLALFALAKRFVRPAWAFAAAVLLAVNPAQLWQAGFSTAEMLGQLLLLTGACFFLDAWRAGRIRDGVTAGLALGAALLARYDAILLLAPLLAFSACAAPWHAHRRAAMACLVSFAVPALHQAVHFRFFGPYYNPAGTVLRPAVIVLLAGCAAWIVLLRVQSLRDWTGRAAGIVPGLGVVIAAAWAFWLWGRAAGWLPVARGDADALNALFLTAIFGPGVVLAVVSVMVWLYREREVASRLWLMASLAATMLVSIKVYNDHFLPWVGRRFVPVTVPLFCIALAVLADRLSGRRRIGALLCVFALAAFVGLNVPAMRAMGTLRDWPGLVAWSGKVAAALPDDARVFCDQRGFAAPLRFLHGRMAYELHLAEKDPSRRELLARVVRASAARGERAYVLTALGPLPDLRMRVVASVPLVSQRIDGGKHRFPLEARPTGAPFVLYAVEP